MIPEEMERTIQFILAQQAQFSSDIMQLKETSDVILKSQTDLTKALTTVVGMVGDLAAAQKETAAQVGQLSESFRGLAEAQTRTENTVAELSDRVNAFIVVVERYISGNGKQKPSA